MGKNTDSARDNHPGSARDGRLNSAQDGRLSNVRDRRLYGAQDMVRISSSACAGCGACCRGMGDTIVLDPYDVWQLAAGTGRTFEVLMGAGVDLHVEEGVILPHLMMREETQSCAFLAEDGRCTIQVRIDKWLGIPDLPRYERYKAEWRALLRRLRARLAAEESAEVQRNINLYFLRTFYMAPYAADCAAAFYEEYGDRVSKFTEAVL